MAENERRTQVLQAEQAIRMLAKSLSGADASKTKFDTLTAILTSAADSVGKATRALDELRYVLQAEQKKACTAITGTEAHVRKSLEEATKGLTQLGEQAVAVAAEQASGAAKRMWELEENVDQETGRLERVVDKAVLVVGALQEDVSEHLTKTATSIHMDFAESTKRLVEAVRTAEERIETKVEKAGQTIAVLKKDLCEQLAKTVSGIHMEFAESTKRLLEAVRSAEESNRKQTIAAAFDSTQQLTNRLDHIEKALLEQAAANTAEVRNYVNVAQEMLVDRLAQTQHDMKSSAEARYKRNRTLLIRMCVVEGAIVLSIALMLWRHW